MVKTFAKILLVNDRGQILFLRRSDTDENRPGGWDFPGGKVEAGEDTFDGVIRETTEEAGVQVHDPRLVFGAERIGPYGVGCWLLYLAYVPDDTPIVLSEEHTAYEWWTPEEALTNSNYAMHQELIHFIIENHVLDKRVQKHVTCRIVLVNDAGEMLIMRRSPTDPSNPGTWDLPGGRAEPDERLVETALRETKEECGIDAPRPELVYATSNPRRDGTGTWVFFLSRVAAGLPVRLSNEHDAYKWIPVADLPQYTEYAVLTRMHAFATTHQLYAMQGDDGD